MPHNTKNLDTDKLLSEIASVETVEGLPPMLTSSDVAKLLRISVQTFRRIVSSGQGPVVHLVGKSSRFYQEDVEAWVRSGEASRARTTRGYKLQ